MFDEIVIGEQFSLHIDFHEDQIFVGQLLRENDERGSDFAKRLRYAHNFVLAEVASDVTEQSMKSGCVWIGLLVKIVNVICIMGPFAARI